MKRRFTENRRRSVFSSPKAQFKIIAVFGILALLFAATNYHVSRAALRSLYAEVTSLPLSHPNRADLAVLYQQQSTTLDAQFLLLTGVSLAVLTLGVVFLSHVIAGPIHRLKAYLEVVAKGEASPSKVVLRKRDFFHDLADTLNRFQESRGMLFIPDDSGQEPDQKDSP